MKTPRHANALQRFLSIGLSWFASICSSFATLSGAPPMDILYDLREANTLKPYVHKINGSDPIHLFPVPQASSVGTNDLNNAITIFTFEQSRVREKSYFQNAVSGMSPGGQYTPLFSKDAIGYGMTRGFTIFDFKNNKIRDFTIHTSIDRDIEQVQAIDGAKNRFLFESIQQNPDAVDWRDRTRVMRLIDLSGEKPVVNKSIELAKSNTWDVHGNRVFICEINNNELNVYNSNLEPDTHPLVHIISKNKGIADFAMVVPHPTLPFAILYGGAYATQYVCWNQPFREEKIKSIFGTVTSTLYYSFSPDGKWVIFLADDFNPKRSYILPVSEKYPNYLGSPILLEGDYFDRDHFAWTDNPVSLVGSSKGKLLRYDLTKESHPETGDKPTFWDYVVDRDLERLRKAGKQGMNPNRTP